jgi:hypothetical protein
MEGLLIIVGSCLIAIAAVGAVAVLHRFAEFLMSRSAPASTDNTEQNPAAQAEEGTADRPCGCPPSCPGGCPGCPYSR